jgi:hypothetical protein
MRLSDELETHGCELDADEFRTLLMDVFHGMFRAWTVDQLVCMPDEAKRFCVTIRKNVRRRLPDPLILGTLLDMRENGDIEIEEAA